MFIDLPNECSPMHRTRNVNQDESNLLFLYNIYLRIENLCIHVLFIFVSINIWKIISLIIHVNWYRLLWERERERVLRCLFMQGYPATAPTAKERSDHFTKSMAVEMEANVRTVGTAEQGLITEAGRIATGGLVAKHQRCQYRRRCDRRCPNHWCWLKD
jgi:hypothetical protein